MDTTLIAQQMRLQEWAEELRQFHASGMSAKDWCLVHNIKPSTFQYRQRKLRKAACEIIEERKETETAFAPVPQHVRLLPEPTPGGIRIQMQDISIEVAPDAPLSQLQFILEVLMHAK